MAQRHPTPLFEPRSPQGAALLFATAYVLWQPVALGMVHAMERTPVPFSTLPQWRDFAVVCAGLGAVAGLAWHAGHRLPRGGWRRAWLRAFTLMLALQPWMHADRWLNLDLVFWLFLVSVSTIAAATVAAPFYRWGERFQDPAVPPRAPVDRTR